jgi:4-diphosphocytidyl-2-C-methyl-D-erythritol kinase
MTAADVLTERAPAKINLCLLVGPARESDGRHELVTVFEPLALHDTVTLEPGADGDADEVVCPGVPGENLAATALARFRDATGWDGAPVRLTIDKSIPVAGGMAGGSADAAAALRLAHRASGLGDDALLHELAVGLGADVPGQVRPRRLLGTGAGEHLEPLPPPPAPYGVLVLPSTDQLSTADVFREGDRLGIPRDPRELEVAVELVHRGRIPEQNDLEAPAAALLPWITDALDAVRVTGADRAMVSGSGPTVLGLYPTPVEARRGADALIRDGWSGPAPIVTQPLSG